MKLKFTRTREEMKQVLRDPNENFPDPAYWVFNDLQNDKWENVTILPPLSGDGELPRVFGHIHGDGEPEIYHFAFGEGVFVMQSEAEILLIKAKAGDEIMVPGNFAHELVNTGLLPLITIDNRRVPHPQSDYDFVLKTHGLGYYLVRENSEIKTIPNSNFPILPQPKWLTAEEFSKR